MKKWASILALALCSILPLQAQIETDGFLGVTFSLEFDGEHAKIPMALDGGSFNQEIITRLTLFSDLAHLGSIYTNSRRFLNGDEVYEYSFVDLLLGYAGYSSRYLLFYYGFQLGHHGFFLQGERARTYYIGTGAQVGMKWFIGQNLQLHNRILAPLPIYRENINELIQVDAITELTLDPLGPIQNPLPDSAHYTVGVRWNYLNLVTENRRSEEFKVEPYLKFTLLY